MKLDFGYSNSRLSPLESAWVLEILWVLAGLLFFFAGPKQSVWVTAGLVLLAFSFLQRWVVTGHASDGLCQSWSSETDQGRTE